MSNLFRKLRRTATTGKDETRGGNYLKYAVGEILLVVIGILIALSINNFNERLKEDKKEKLTIEILSEEIQKNLVALQSDFDNNTMILDSLTIYLRGELERPNEYAKAQFISYVLNYNWGILEYPTLDQELGPNRVIKDMTELSASLKALNTAHIALDFQLNYLNELFNNRTIPYLLESGAGTGLISTMFQYNNEAPKLSRLYGTEALNNILSIQQLFLFSYNSRIQRLIIQSKESLEVLQEL